MQVLVSDFSGGTDEYTNVGLISSADYLYALCGKYGIAAQTIVGSPGYVSPITTGTAAFVSPIRITSFNFSSATEWSGSNNNNQEVLPSYELEVYWNDLGRFLNLGTEWVRTAQGFQIINNESFDSTANNYTFYIYISQ